jgi:hypothetical protein
MGTRQVETATVIGSITGNGNATVTVTGARLSTNPTAVSVAVTTADNTASLVALACRNALALNSVISNIYQVSGSGADIVLTERVANANDATLNIAIANDTCTGLTAAPTSTNTTAGTGLDNAYITLAEMKATDELGITDTTSDTAIEAVINAVSRAVDDYCNRYFYKNTADETRYFRPTQRDQCLVGDLISVTSLKTDSTLDRTYADTWATTDYDLYPYNAALDGQPYFRIDRNPDGDWWFTKSPKYVKITGVWGWPSVPHPVKQACLIWALRTWKRHATPLGVSATTALGEMSVKVPPPDPDVQTLLADYKLVITGVI